jgi:two-component system sensor histidine kinase KdpD
MTPSVELAPRRRPQPLPNLAGYAAALALVVVATLAAVAVDQMVRATNLSLIFVLPVVIAAVSFGTGPALLAAAAGIFAFNFFLLEPRYTFQVDDPANVWALGLLLTVAVIVSAVAARARRQALDAWRNADQARALQALARTLMGVADQAGIAQASAEALARLFASPAVVMVADDDSLGPPARAGGAMLSPADQEAAGWALASRLATRGGAYPVEEAAFDFWPVAVSGRPRAIIGLRIADPDVGRPADPERLVEIVGGYLSVALAREAFAAQVMETRVEMAGERLKADLLSAVSHDLKTPLSTILVTLQSLQRFPRRDARARAELLALAETETARLAGLVSNLLDMSRLDAGAVVIEKVAIPPAALLAGARRRAAASLAGRDLIDEVDPRAPALLADPALTETALANVLENAGKYAAQGSAIRVRFEAAGAEGVLEVADEGPGFEGAVEPLFEKFTRGVQGDGRPPGTGLGLSIVRGFLQAQGGRVEADNRQDLPAGGTGARVRLILPLAPDAAATGSATG